MKKGNENRGAALVTVLIAVTFMAVLASSLIYMAYMNYLTKAMRYGATDNFYTDEFALDELSTTLQQVAANVTTGSIDDAKTAICNAVGKHSSNGFDAYSETAVASLITTAAKDATITVATDDRLKDDAGNLQEKSLIVADDYIKLCGVQITATTAEGYTSTITSDIIISFPNTTDGKLDINDFSIISEATINFPKGGCHVYSGNMLVQAKGASTALEIGTGGYVGLLSPQAIFDGDFSVTNNSALYVAGNCIVYGNITIDSTSTLIVDGTLKYSGNLTGGGTVIGEATRDTSLSRSGRLDTPIITKQLCDSVWIYGENGGYSWAEDFYELSIDDLFTKGNAKCDVTGVSSSGTTVHSQFYGVGQGGNISSYNDSLILYGNNGGGFNISSSSTAFINSTLLTTDAMTSNATQCTTYMTRMTDADYEAAKNLMYYGQVNKTGENHEFHTYFKSGNMEDYNFGSMDHTLVLSNLPSTDPNYDADDNRVFAADNTGKNYLPFRYFISEDSSVIITDIFGTAFGGADPANSIVYYELWSKD